MNATLETTEAPPTLTADAPMPALSVGVRVSVRRGVAADVPALLPLVERAFAEMDFAGTGFSFDRDTVQAVLEKSCVHPAFDLLVACYESAVAGLGVLITVPTLTDRHRRASMETVWHTDPQLPVLARGRCMVALLAAMEVAARRRRVDALQFSVKLGTPAQRLLSENGFDALEMKFGKRLTYG